MFMQTRNETTQVLIIFAKSIQMKLNCNIAGIRSDHDTEFQNAQIKGFCADHGIHHNFYTPKTPQQNGVVEIKNKTLVDIDRTMLINSGFAINFWSEEVNTSCYIRSRCLIRSVLKKTPYELLIGRKPSLSYLKAFGCKCFVMINGMNDLGKFNPKSDEGVFVGYSSTSKAYIVYNKRTLCIEESVHVIFNESGEMNNIEDKDDLEHEKLMQIQRDSLVQYYGGKGSK